MSIDLALREDLFVRLTLEAAVRHLTISDLIGKIVGQVMEKDLVGDILRTVSPDTKIAA
jgi:hypothetical protein